MATKQIGSKKWEKKQSATAAAWSPYKPFKEQIHAAVMQDGRGIVSVSWLALRGIVRSTVNADAPKWGGMDDTALGKRIGFKNIAWAHVADAWGVSMTNGAFLLDANDPHYAAVRAQALAFHAAVTGKLPGSLNAPPVFSFQALATEGKIKSALTLALAGGE
jgi:hypothetical protein